MYDSPAFNRDPGLLRMYVKRMGVPPPQERGWMAEASLYRLGFDQRAVRWMVTHGIFECMLDDPKSGMGCLFMRTFCNTDEEKGNLLAVMPAAKRLFDPEELEGLMHDPVKRQEVVDALAGYARLGGDLTVE